MKKKEKVPTAVKQFAAKSLKSKLMTAVHKVLKANKAELSAKIEKVINKSINKIVKKTDQEIKKAIAVT